MNSERFKSIVEFNKAHETEVADNIRDFYLDFGIDSQSSIMNIEQVVRMEMEERRFIMISLPLKDKEIGAMAYKGDFWGYLFVNSTLPKVNVNFALCHELYHIHFQPDSFHNTVEIYIDEHYKDEESERMANLFAGAVLMPKGQFSSMFERLRKKGLDEVRIICHLMSYFCAPYAAVLIRSYELGLMNEQGESLKNLLQNGYEECIKEHFKTDWLDDSVLRASYRNDICKLDALIDEIGAKEARLGRMSENSIKKIKANVKTIYSGLVEEYNGGETIEQGV